MSPSEMCHRSPTVLMETEAVFSSLGECSLSRDCLVEFRDVTSALGLIPSVMFQAPKVRAHQFETRITTSQ